MGYNVLKGAETTQHVFASVEYDIDPLVHHSNVEVQHLTTMRQLHEMHAHRVHLDFLRGMFTHVSPDRRAGLLALRACSPLAPQAPAPACTPDEEKDELCFLAIRSEELMALKLRARTALTPALATDMAALPERCAMRLCRQTSDAPYSAAQLRSGGQAAVGRLFCTPSDALDGERVHWRHDYAVVGHACGRTRG